MRKNSLVGMNFNDVMHREINRVVENPVYCKLCGLDIKVPSKNSAGGAIGGWRADLPEELERETHKKCYMEYYSKRR